MTLFEKIKVVDKEFFEVLNQELVFDTDALMEACDNILTDCTPEKGWVVDDDREEVYNTLKVKHFPERCNKELLKDPKLVLNLMLAF